MKKLHNSGEFWEAVNKLGDQQSFYLLEQFVPGDIYHVDTITYEKQVLFSVASKYGRPPMEVSQSGDVFTTRTLARRLGRRARTARPERAGAEGLRHVARRFAQRVHTRSRWQALFPGDLGAGGRRAHRRPGRSGDRTSTCGRSGRRWRSPAENCPTRSRRFATTTPGC